MNSKQINKKVNYFHVKIRKMDVKDNEHFGGFIANDISEVLSFLSENLDFKDLGSITVDAHKVQLQVIGDAGIGGTK